MGTRAIIARLDPRSGGWDGIYLNNDGEPQLAAPRIYSQVKRNFNADVDAAYEHFVSRHPGGWYRLGVTVSDNMCYCHPANRDRAALGPFIASATPAALNWIYVLRPEGLEVRRWHQGTLTTLPWDGQLTRERILRAVKPKRSRRRSAPAAETASAA